MDRARTSEGEGEALHTRDRIVRAALRLFAAEGIAGTSMRRIASELGFTVSALYAHYRSKDEIIARVLEEAGAPLVLRELEAEAALHGDDPGAVVRHLGERLVAEWDTPRARLTTSVLVREGAFEREAGSRGAGLLAAGEEVQRRMAPLFRRWTESGLIRADVPPEQLAWELFAPLDMVRLRFLHGHATPEELRTGRGLAERHLLFFLSGVLREG
ncbi:MAG TPA: helix-turn-helix domain-containing protein [Longimicrobiaceae bacterium]|nr:helix-turn-helix domain-containing protein [Longimicrobiaceae bacterium]